MTVDVAEAVVAVNANAGRKACIIIEGNEDNKLTFHFNSRKSLFSLLFQQLGKKCMAQKEAKATVFNKKEISGIGWDITAMNEIWALFAATLVYYSLFRINCAPFTI